MKLPGRLALYAALSVAWSWPLAAHPLGIEVAVGGDQQGTRLFVALARAMDGGFWSALTGWPEGQSLVRADSFVLLALARLLPFTPVTFAPALCALVGPVASAWGADLLARRVGASDVYATVAGIAYAFAGVAATALLEGYPYMLLDPWTPLAAVAVLDATDAAVPSAAHAAVPSAAQGAVASSARRVLRPALRAAGWWTLALLTSGYVGLGAALVIAGLALGAVARERAALRAAAAVAIACAGPAVAYTAWFAAGESNRTFAAFADIDPATALATGSARLDTLVTRTASADFSVGYQGALLGMTAVVLAAFAPRVLGRERGWRRWGVLAAVLVALSLGPRLQLDAGSRLVPWVGGVMTPLSAFFRFPGRLLHPASLAVGVLAAVVATRLHARAPSRAPLLVAAAAVDALVGAGTPFRTLPLPVEAPAAYAAAPAGWAVMELWPLQVGPATPWEYALVQRSWGYAALHGRPILGDFGVVDPRHDHRQPVATWLHAALLAGDTDLRAPLRSLGIGAVALHPDLYPPELAAELRAALRAALGEPAAESVDGGEALAVWTTVAAGSPAPDREAAVRAWQAVASGEGLP